MIRTRSRRLFSIVAVLFTLVLIAGGLCHADAEALTRKNSAGSPEAKPLVIFYSRTGTTRTIARELAKILPCETEEIISRKERHSLWAITCVFDQLFDRDDDVEPVKKDIASYNPLIIAAPVWIHRISSPMRTFLKYAALKENDVFLVLTNNGNFDEEDEKDIRESITSCGLEVKGCYPVCTSDKDEAALHRDARIIMETIAKQLIK